MLSALTRQEGEDKFEKRLLLALSFVLLQICDEGTKSFVLVACIETSNLSHFL